jgi:hypothetical protein
MFLLLGVATLSSAGAADRLKVTGPPAGQDAAERLVGSVAMACNSGDFIGFMDHFTPTHRRKIRGRMEDIFIKHQPQMEIQQVTLLSEEAEAITFGVRYAWHDKGKPATELASKVKARKIEDQWKLDGEIVKSVTRAESASDPGHDQPATNGLPAGWDPFNPPPNLINQDLEHLRGDIGIRPGRGCANGQCRR